MTVTAPAKCDLDFCLRQFILSLGIADQNYPDGSEVAASAPYTKADLKERLGQADYEVNSWIVGTLDHPYRPQFDTEETGLLGDRDLIPAHLGDYSIGTIKSYVTVSGADVAGVDGDYIETGTFQNRPFYNKIGAAVDSGISAIRFNGSYWEILDDGGNDVYFDEDELVGLAYPYLVENWDGGITTPVVTGAPTLVARRAQSLAHIEKVRLNPALYGSPGDLYFVHAGRVHLGDPDRLIVFNIPNIEIQQDDPTTVVRSFTDIDVLINASKAHSSTAAENFTTADIGRRLAVAGSGLDGTILSLLSPVNGASVDVIVDDTATTTVSSANATLYERGDIILQAPLLYQWGVIATAILACANQGFNVPHRNYWSTIYQVYEQKVKGKELSLPEPDRFARIAT